MNNRFLYQNKVLKDRRKELRNNQTESEKILWDRLRNSNLGFKFTRQYSAGPYILDFYCPKLRLAIELDGGVHQNKETKIYDQDRDNYLRNVDIKTIRFWNSEVESNIENVVREIEWEMKSRVSSPSSYLKRRVGEVIGMLESLYDHYLYRRIIKRESRSGRMGGRN